MIFGVAGGVNITRAGSLRRSWDSAPWSGDLATLIINKFMAKRRRTALPDCRGVSPSARAGHRVSMLFLCAANHKDFPGVIGAGFYSDPTQNAAPE